MKAAETKTFEIGVENVQLYHNRGTSIGTAEIASIDDFFNPWSRIAKGVNRWNRIGDKITPRGMSIKLWVANKYDRPNTMVRIIVAVLPKTRIGLLGTSVVTNSFDPFEASQQYGNVENALVLKPDHDKGVKFLYDRIHTINPNMAEQINTVRFCEKAKSIKIWIKRKKSRNIVFNSDYSDIVNKPLAVYAIPYEQYSTSQLDNVTSLAGLMTCYFKDV